MGFSFHGLRALVRQFARLGACVNICMRMLSAFKALCSHSPHNIAVKHIILFQLGKTHRVRTHIRMVCPLLFAFLAHHLPTEKICHASFVQEEGQFQCAVSPSLDLVPSSQPLQLAVRAMVMGLPAAVRIAPGLLSRREWLPVSTAAGALLGTPRDEQHGRVHVNLADAHNQYA